MKRVLLLLPFILIVAGCVDAGHGYGRVHSGQGYPGPYYSDYYGDGYRSPAHDRRNYEHRRSLERARVHERRHRRSDHDDRKLHRGQRHHDQRRANVRHDDRRDRRHAGKRKHRGRGRDQAGDRHGRADDRRHRERPGHQGRRVGKTGYGRPIEATRK